MSGVASTSVSSTNEIMLWHHRFGHSSFLYLKRLFPSLFDNKNTVSFECEICQLAKHTRMSFSPKVYIPSTPFSLIHSDILGPSKITTCHRKRWFLTFIDDHTRVTWVYLLHNKSEASHIFKVFHKMIQTQFQSQIRVLRTDNGKEYFNSILSDYLLENGIQHQSSCVDTPQQNGVSERKNRHLLEVARALMFTMHIPKYLWGDAILTATYLINRMPSRPINFETPLSVLSKTYPHVSKSNTLPLRIFGCTAFVHIHDHNRSKLDPRAIKTVFIGYSPTQKGYRCYCPKTKKTYISCDVTFFENTPYFSPTSLQGEKWDEACCSWDIHDLPLLDVKLDTAVSIPESTKISPPVIDPISPVLETRGDSTLSISKQPELQVYSRKKKSQANKEIMNPTHSHEDEPMVESHSPNESGKFSHIPDLDMPIALRKGVRSCTHHPISKFISYSNLSPSLHAFTSSLSSVFIPRSIEEALSIPEWKVAVLEEMHALRQNNTWSLVELPQEKNTVGCKWLFTVKYKADGSIERHKARLVAKGFTQTYGIDYTETFAPVAKLNTIRILLSLAVNSDWPLHQLDIKNAFLNGELAEEVFMCQPPGFEENLGSHTVCKLNKSLYGLKQSPRAWFDRFSKVIKEFGYVQGQADHTLFVKHAENEKITILIVYVDDIIVTGNDNKEVERVKQMMAKEFEVKDLGALRYFLGMEVARSKKGISVSQRKYTLDLLEETGMLGCRPSKTPVELGNKGKMLERGLVDKGQYQRLVGKLIYLSHTRPDIAFAVSLVSQHMHSPCQGHLNAVYRILRYLKRTPGKCLFFAKTNDRKVKAFTDADWAGSINDRKSTSGYCTLLWGNLVTWRSKKQSVVSRSSAEAEFRAMARGVCELIWIRRVLKELKIGFEEPMLLYCDNKSAISIAHNPVHHDRTKHVEVDRHFIKEKLDGNIIKLEYVPTSHQLADILTKGLSKQTHDFLEGKFGLINIYSQA